jgi:PAS domain S-box-containing protein
MKILYIARERAAAVLAAQALRGIAQNVTLTFAPTLSSALHWIHGTDTTAAVIVEAEVEGPADRSGRDVLEARLAESQAHHQATLAREARICTALQHRLLEVEAELRNAEERRASETAAAADQLAKRHAEFTASLAQAAHRRDALAEQLSVATALLEETRRGRTADAATAAETLARREAELGSALAERLAGEAAIRTALERDLTESRGESARARRRFLYVLSAHRRRTREGTARLQEALACQGAEAERTLRERAEEIQQVQHERETLQGLLDTTQGQFQRLSAEYEQLRQSLDQVRTAFHTLEQVASEHAIERARLESVVAEREAELSMRTARHLASEQAAQDALTQVQQTSRLAIESKDGEIARLGREIDAIRHELDASQKEKRGQFERAPYGLCLCTRDGVITHVNHSLVRLLGYRRADELRSMDFAATVPEGGGDLRWLIERSVMTGKRESVEATWKTRDRRRVDVRLHALSITDGSVEIVVEDITSLRELEHRLRQAQRMEAVGRLASEVASTCDTLLRDVTENGRQWLTARRTDTSLDPQGELLLGDVTRAASLLRRLVIYGDTQLKALEPVSVQRVLRDLEPVLKRVAGDDIELVLPKTSASVDVDVDVERVQRVLVNVAGYARERMPYGGQVRIDLTTTVLGHRFTAKYPNVRPGPHVLITVSEVRRTARQELPIEIVRSPDAGDGRSPSDRPGVDLGAMLELIGTCGGHVWMEAEPSGNMTLKIHLPKRADDGQTVSAAPVARSNRGRQLARWFRANPPAATARP